MVIKLHYQINKLSSEVLLQEKKKKNTKKMQNITNIAEVSQEVIQQR